MDTILPIIVIAAVFLFVAITLYRRLGKNHSQPSRTSGGAGSSGDAGTAPMFFADSPSQRHSHHDSDSGGYSGGDSGGSDSGGGGGGE